MLLLVIGQLCYNIEKLRGNSFMPYIFMRVVGTAVSLFYKFSLVANAGYHTLHF